MDAIGNIATTIQAMVRECRFISITVIMRKTSYGSEHIRRVIKEIMNKTLVPDLGECLFTCPICFNALDGLSKMNNNFIQQRIEIVCKVKFMKRKANSDRNMTNLTTHTILNKELLL